MITYKDFLDFITPISEEMFNNVIKYIPEFEPYYIRYIDADCLDDETDLCIELLSCWLQTFDYPARIGDLDFDTKQLTIEDVDSIEDLSCINKELSDLGWTIENYHDLEKGLEEKRESENIQEMIYDIRNKVYELPYSKLIEISKIINEND